MRFTITLPDDIADRYAEQAVGSGSRSLEEVMAGVLTALSGTNLVTGRCLIVTADVLEKLESIFGHGHVLSSTDLYQKTCRLASIRIGEYQFKWSPAALTELQDRAERNGITLEAEILSVCRAMEASFFNHTGTESKVAYEFSSPLPWQKEQRALKETIARLEGQIRQLQRDFDRPVEMATAAPPEAPEPPAPEPSEPLAPPAQVATQPDLSSMEPPPVEPAVAAAPPAPALSAVVKKLGKGGTLKSPADLPA